MARIEWEIKQANTAFGGRHTLSPDCPVQPNELASALLQVAARVCPLPPYHRMLPAPVSFPRRGLILNRRPRSFSKLLRAPARLTNLSAHLLAHLLAFSTSSTSAPSSTLPLPPFGMVAPPFRAFVSAASSIPCRLGLPRRRASITSSRGGARDLDRGAQRTQRTTMRGCLVRGRGAAAGRPFSAHT